MIKFFRRIRYDLMEKNNTGKYMKYAIGEIVLVVIGILIALQINNANEVRKSNIREQGILKNLIQELKADLQSYNENLETLENIKILHKQLFEIGVNNKESILIEKPNFIRRTLFYNPITKENDPFIASKISNDEIRNEILTYFRNIKNMEYSYREFEEIVREKIRPYLGDKSVQNLSMWFENERKLSDNGKYENLISPKELASLSKEKDFQQLLLESSIKCEETFDALQILIVQNKHLMQVITENLK